MGTFDYGKTAEAGVTADAVLKGISAKQVYDTKNPAYRVLSFSDKTSETGFANLVLNAENFTEQKDGSYDVNLGPDNRWREVSVKKNGTFVRERRDVTEIVSQVTAKDTQAEKPAEKAAETSKETAKLNAYLNYLPEKLIRETKNPDFKIVSIPCSASENGFANLTVHSKRVFATKKAATGEIVPNRMNVNLGPADGNVMYSVKEHGEYVKKTMTAGDLAEQYQSGNGSLKLEASEEKTGIDPEKIRQDAERLEVADTMMDEDECVFE